MRVPFVEYLTFALFTSASDLGHSASGPPSVEVQVAPFNLGVTDPTVNAIRCWPSSSAAGVSASFGPLHHLRENAHTFCNIFSTNSSHIRMFGSGKNVFGWQSAIFVGNFLNWTSCFNTFNTLVTRCYGTANPTIPVTLGGTIVDAAGTTLVISFGNALAL